MYLDIGAHHPYYLSNTAYFYKQNWKGVSIEPDPSLYNLFIKERPKEIALNVGIGIEAESETDFYIMNIPTLNTFSKEEADKYATYPDKFISKTIKLKLKPINQILNQYFKSSGPHFVSIDVEGLDLDILKSFDFINFRPEVFCIETITYTEDKTERKVTEIIDYMTAMGYFIYADTYINTLFVDKTKWLNR